MLVDELIVQLLFEEDEVAEAGADQNGETDPDVERHEAEHQRVGDRHLQDVQQRLVGVQAVEVHSLPLIVHGVHIAAVLDVRRRILVVQLVADRGELVESAVLLQHELAVVLETLVQHGDHQEDEADEHQIKIRVDHALLEQNGVSEVEVEVHLHHRVIHRWHAVVVHRHVAARVRRHAAVVHAAVVYAAVSHAVVSHAAMMLLCTDVMPLWCCCDAAVIRTVRRRVTFSYFRAICLNH